MWLLLTQKSDPSDVKIDFIREKKRNPFDDSKLFWITIEQCRTHHVSNWFKSTTAESENLAQQLATYRYNR
jgi:hypothetical protein